MSIGFVSITKSTLYCDSDSFSLQRRSVETPKQITANATHPSVRPCRMYRKSAFFTATHAGVASSEQTSSSKRQVVSISLPKMIGPGMDAVFEKKYILKN